MPEKLHYNTVTPLLLLSLKQLMRTKEFTAFRLVGGTSLSLQRGHRFSIDIDLFTDAKYESINFRAIDRYLRSTYAYVDTNDYDVGVGMGKAYYVGKSKDKCIKLDVFYTDAFIKPVVKINGIRMASVEEIIAMKLDIISKGGRKKDFWDIHELMEDYPINNMFALHEERYPYSHNKKTMYKKFTDFTNANFDFDPVCLKGKHWEIIKLDIIDFVKQLE